MDAHPQEVVHHPVVEVLTAQVGVTRGGLHLEDALLDGQHRHIECPPPEVEDEHVALLTLLVQAVRDSCRGGLVDDSHHVKAGDRSRVLRRLSLRVVEVRGHGDHCVLHLRNVGHGQKRNVGDGTSSTLTKPWSVIPVYDTMGRGGDLL